MVLKYGLAIIFADPYVWASFRGQGMVSNYLKQSRSIEELYALIEADRVAAAEIAATVFDNEVAMAITNIGEINQVANARILADSQVASARMMTDAEVTAVALTAKAEAAIVEIKSRLQQDSRRSEITHSMIAEISRIAVGEISDSAQDSVKGIQLDAKYAIKCLQDNAAKAIEDIKATADDIAVRIAESTKRANTILTKQKERHPSPEDVVRHAETASQNILGVSSQATQQIHDAAAITIAELNTITDAATKIITEAVTASERRVLTARDRALASIQDIVSLP